jgi:hypothetical protein
VRSPHAERIYFERPHRLADITTAATVIVCASVGLVSAGGIIIAKLIAAFPFTPASLIGGAVLWA